MSATFWVRKNDVILSWPLAATPQDPLSLVEQGHGKSLPMLGKVLSIRPYFSFEIIPLFLSPFPYLVTLNRRSVWSLFTYGFIIEKLFSTHYFSLRVLFNHDLSLSPLISLVPQSGDDPRIHKLYVPRDEETDYKRKNQDIFADTLCNHHLFHGPLLDSTTLELSSIAIIISWSTNP